MEREEILFRLNQIKDLFETFKQLESPKDDFAITTCLNSFKETFDHDLVTAVCGTCPPSYTGAFHRGLENGDRERIIFDFEEAIGLIEKHTNL